MKKGTKANAIDDLGKFDGSKMTIKVDGKQIYPQKRYAIVRVDNNCPFYTELVTTKCWIYKNEKSCIGFKCKIKKTYGDTKEQLVRKVAQSLRKIADIEGDDKEYKYWRIAVEIVEFLGVE